MEPEPPLPPVVSEQSAPPPRGLIAIIIDDFGYNFDTVARGFLKLDAHLTYAIIPGHQYSQKFAREAVRAGYETMIHMPMESVKNLAGEDDYILKTNQSSAEVERRLRLALDAFPAARGMNNHQGSQATTDERLMNIVGALLKERGKYFVDSRTSSQSVAEEEIHALGVPVTHRNVFLDNDADPDLIRRQLDQLVRHAVRHGSAVGIGHGRPNTLAVLQAEIPRLKSQGYRFVFASQVVE